MANSKCTKAVLIFAAGIQTDLALRGFTKRFSEFLQIPSLTSDVTADADVHLFSTDIDLRSNSKRSESIKIFTHAQTGASFSERLQNAIAKLAQTGYQQIIVIGSDCPELQSRDIKTALAQLSKHRLVIGPDHRGGCYLIGFHIQDSHKLSEIQWQKNTDRDQLQHVFGEENTCLLSVKHDIDSIEDLRLLASCKNKIGARARSLLKELKQHHKSDTFLSLIHLPTDIQRSRWQLPPPSELPFSSPEN